MWIVVNGWHCAEDQGEFKKLVLMQHFMLGFCYYWGRNSAWPKLALLLSLNLNTIVITVFTERMLTKQTNKKKATHTHSMNNSPEGSLWPFPPLVWTVFAFATGCHTYCLSIMKALWASCYFWLFSLCSPGSPLFIISCDALTLAGFALLSLLHSHCVIGAKPLPYTS